MGSGDLFFPKGIVFLWVDEHQSQGGFIKEELVYKSVAFLPGQVPKQCLPFDSFFLIDGQFQAPNLYAMGGMSGDEFVFHKGSSSSFITCKQAPDFKSHMRSVLSVNPVEFEPN
jgi:hypothetical protein